MGKLEYAGILESFWCSGTSPRFSIKMQSQSVILRIFETLLFSYLTEMTKDAFFSHFLFKKKHLNILYDFALPFDFMFLG